MLRIQVEAVAVEYAWKGAHMRRVGFMPTIAIRPWLHETIEVESFAKKPFVEVVRLLLR
jgi:hypothetical protein